MAGRTTAFKKKASEIDWKKLKPYWPIFALIGAVSIPILLMIFSYKFRIFVIKIVASFVEKFILSNILVANLIAILVIVILIIICVFIFTRL
jgi:ABC-type bacteriocin/lantibiotic exporter with double-glycine peptidase domain